MEEIIINIDELKNELSIRCKNGLPFLLSANIIWSIILVIFLLPFEIINKNIFTFYITGIMFPLSILISKVIKADWKSNDNPLGMLGLFLNIAQLMYFPMLFFAFSKNPNQMIIFFAIITGAHLFPYGWFYNTKAFTIMAPVMSIAVTIIGWNLNTSKLWFIPLAMIVLLIVLNIWIYIDYNVKLKFTKNKVKSN